MNKKVIIVGIILLCMLVSLPSTIANSNSSEDFNLKVYIKPLRFSFPRIYGGNGQPIGFVAGATNEGPESSPGFTLKFELIPLFCIPPDETTIHNETMGFGSFPPGQGQGRSFTWCTMIGNHIRIFEARATINIDDANLEDNTKSYYYITLPLKFI